MELSPIRSRLLQYAHAADVPPLVLCLRCKDLAIDPHRPEQCSLCCWCRPCSALVKPSEQCVHGKACALVPAPDIARLSHALALVCPHCKQSFKSPHFQEHVATCPHAMVVCPFGCSEYFIHVDMDQHETVCDYKRSPCPLECGASIIKKELAAHQRVCLLGQLTCKYCGDVYLREAAQSHDSACDAFAVTCPKGCTQQVPRATLAAHMQSCTAQLSLTPAITASTIEIFNIAGVTDQVLRSWFAEMGFDAFEIHIARRDASRVWLRNAQETNQIHSLQQAFTSRAFPFVRAPLPDHLLPFHTFCPALSLVDCPMHQLSYEGDCPFRHVPVPSQVCRYWKIGRPCLSGALCPDKHPPVRLLSLNFERMALGRCKWCADPDPFHPAWECEKAPYNDATSGALRSGEEEDWTPDGTPRGRSSSASKSNALAMMLVEILSLEPSRSKHITSLGSFLYQRYPNAKTLLIQSGMKLKAFLRKYPHFFHYDAETCLVTLLQSDDMGFPSTSPTNAPPLSTPCRWYALGSCKKGALCPYLHDPTARPRKVCDFYRRTGRCAWGDECKWSHELPDESVIFAERAISPPRMGQRPIPGAQPRLRRDLSPPWQRHQLHYSEPHNQSWPVRHPMPFPVDPWGGQWQRDTSPIPHRSYNIVNAAATSTAGASSNVGGVSGGRPWAGKPLPTLDPNSVWSDPPSLNNSTSSSPRSERPSRHAGPQVWSSQPPHPTLSATLVDAQRNWRSQPTDMGRPPLSASVSRVRDRVYHADPAFTGQLTHSSPVQRHRQHLAASHEPSQSLFSGPYPPLTLTDDPTDAFPPHNRAPTPPHRQPIRPPPGLEDEAERPSQNLPFTMF